LGVLGQRALKRWANTYSELVKQIEAENDATVQAAKVSTPTPLMPSQAPSAWPSVMPSQAPSVFPSATPSMMSSGAER